MHNQNRDDDSRHRRRSLVIIWSIIGLIALIIAGCVGIIIWQGYNTGITTVIVILTILGVLVGIIGLLPAFLQVHYMQREQAMGIAPLRPVQGNQTAAPEQIAPPATSQATSVFSPSLSGGSTSSAIANFILLEESVEAQITAFEGRSDEIDILARAIRQTRHRIVAIYGQGGIGKTSLAIKLVKQLKEEFDEIIGVSLRNAPPLKSVLHEIILRISGCALAELPETVDECIESLRQLLYKNRYLLFFDNGESILLPDDTRGHYISGYEKYGEFFKVIAETNHKSCLLVTSREIYREIQFAEGKQVLAYRLPGLQPSDARRMLDAQSLKGSDAAKDRLIGLYEGNPLAIKLAAVQIRDLNNGNIESFLAQPSTAIDEIDELLEQQFSRLPTLERELMNCLAVAMEPLSQKELLEGYFQHRPLQPVDLTTALRSLKRRDLLEAGEDNFSLQNVIMEYALRKIIEKAHEEIKSCSFDFLRNYAFLRASGQDYIRETQIRLILQPLLKQVQKSYPPETLEQVFKHCLDVLRQAPSQNGHTDYAAGNIINLWIQQGLPLKGADFSHLTIRQAYFQGVDMQEVNFTASNLETSVFTDTFGDVFSVALHSTPQSEVLAAGTSSNEVRLWKRHADGNILWRILPAHTDWVRTIAFSPTGPLLASGSDDQDIYLWNIDDHQHFKKEKPLRKLSGHKGRIYSVAFRSDGRRLLSGSEDGTIKLWDTSSGDILQEFLGHKGTVYAVAFLHNGHTIISGGEDHTVRMWDRETGQPIHVFRDHQDEVKTIAFSLGGDVVASGSRDRTIRIYNAQTYRCLNTLQGESPIGSILFNGDEHFLLSGEENGFIKLWNVDTGDCVQTLVGHKDRVWSLALSADKKTLVSGGRDQSIRLWNIETDKCIQTQLGKNTWVYTVAFNHAGTVLASGSGGDSKIRLWSPQTGQELKVLQSEGWVRAVAFHPNDKLLASAGDDASVRLWDVETGQLVHQFKGHTNTIRTIAFNRTGEILASAGEDRTIRLWNVDNGTCEQIIQVPSDVWSIAFHPNGNYLASAGDDLTIRIRDVRTPGRERLLNGHTNWIYSLCYSPDGSYLASCSQDETVRLWPLVPLKGAHILVGHQSWVHGAAFNLECSLLVTVSQDQSVRLWDVRTGKPRGILGQHPHWIYAVAFSPDGRTVATGAGDGAIKLWDVPTGTCTHTLHNVRPYENMNITDVRGLEPAQIEILKALGAIEATEKSSN